MLYEVTTPFGRSSIIEADSSRSAKINVCGANGVMIFDHLSGISSMKAQKVIVHYPETLYRPVCSDELLQLLEGKDILIYDEHHGTSVRIRNATVESIRYFMDEYTTIIVLSTASKY